VDNIMKEKTASSVPPLKPYTGATEVSKPVFQKSSYGPVSVPNTIPQEAVGSPNANPGPDVVVDEQPKEEKKIIEEIKQTLNCTDAFCDYGQASPLGRKTPYDRRLTPVPSSPLKPKVNPKEINVKSMPPADPSKPKVEPSLEQAGIVSPLPQSLSAQGLSTVDDSTPQMFSQTYTVPKKDYSPEFLDQIQNMEMSREMDKSAKIKATSELRSLRGEDEDSDSEAVRALEQIEMDKINLNILGIAKKKKALL
jgi:hypothetical protein